MTKPETRALIGHTGFVGGNLQQQSKYDEVYNSRNIQEIDGRTFSSIIISAAQAKKWWANQNPEEDWRGISVLLQHLSETKCEQAILISTIDVLHLTSGMNESSDPDMSALTAYGKHRLQLEQEVNKLFDKVLIVRLPGLFGGGLKKNVIYDLLNHNGLEKINPLSSFQYYNLANLSRDIQTALDERLDLIHLFPEPIDTQDLLQRFFPNRTVGADAAPEAHYDHRTCHGALFDGDSRYIADNATVLNQIDQFIQTELAEHP